MYLFRFCIVECYKVQRVFKRRNEIIYRTEFEREPEPSQDTTLTRTLTLTRTVKQNPSRPCRED
ncbi:hypothetical protein HanPSC8_Chr15g0692311 [Helianthus annuus]|nr:hypothetical protein HanPSC8_Chr15g0692311 [Helianthus annuus]